MLPKVKGAQKRPVERRSAVPAIELPTGKSFFALLRKAERKELTKILYEDSKARTQKGVREWGREELARSREEVRLWRWFDSRVSSLRLFSERDSLPLFPRHTRCRESPTAQTDARATISLHRLLLLLLPSQ